LSGPALEREYTAERRRAGSEPDLRPTTREIVSAACGGDAVAQAVLEQYEERLARALGSVINVVDPHVIVLGGGLSNVDRFYDSVPRLWAPYVFSDAVTTRLVRAAHGDSSGVRGAAWLWEGRDRLRALVSGLWSA